MRPVRLGWLVLGLAAAPLAAQQPPVKGDTVRTDSAAVVLAPIVVSVTRAPEPLARVPFAVGVVGSDEIRRGRQTLGLDEVLNEIPGVYAANRYNFSLDQRLSIRGFGSRSNFGVRGIKVLLDGIPQTLPDGQGQLTNVDLGTLDRVEVLRGAASALYGNAAGGVISLHSEPAAAAPFAERLRLEGGAFNSRKWQSWSSARLGRASGTLSISRFTTDGFRQHSAADFRQLAATAGYLLSGTTTLTVRLDAADDPQAQNPGALTPAQYTADRTAAAQNNLSNDADKAVTQQQLAITLRHETLTGSSWSAAVYGLHRGLENPLATGTYVTIGRHAGGFRLQATQPFGATGAPGLTAGIDGQWLRDNRANYASPGGVRTDTVQLDQRETVSELGPFVQLHWSPAPPVLLAAGVRYDRVGFGVTDHYLADGDQTGDRTMKSVSGNLGVSYRVSGAFLPYANIATSFETPTTTELVNRPDGTGGLNPALGPQRAVNYEMGARGAAGGVTYTLAGFIDRVRDAIVQYQEVGGRAYFRNAGRTRNAGIEASLSVQPSSVARLFASYTYADYRFTDYRVVNGATTDTLDGNRLPGVPRHFLRAGVRLYPLTGLSVSVDQTLSSSLYADDGNSVVVAGWGAGVTDLRVNWMVESGSAQIAPFVGINNLFGKRYVSSVTINGFGGRVLEPAPGRNLYLGAEVGWRTGP